MIKNIMKKLTVKEDLTSEEAYDLIVAIKNDDINEAQIAGFLVALLMKGPTLTEITAIAKAMRDNCIRINPNVSEELMDTCGTGGGLSTFNISTAVALVAAAAGIPVAKHGSRSISSLSGSADVLEALGVQINQTPRGVESRLRMWESLSYMHPYFIRLWEGAVTERDLGIKTIFYTIIGPLINPSKASRHVLGVYRLELVDSGQCC